MEPRGLCEVLSVRPRDREGERERESERESVSAAVQEPRSRCFGASVRLGSDDAVAILGSVRDFDFSLEVYQIVEFPNSGNLHYVS